MEPRGEWTWPTRISVWSSARVIAPRGSTGPRGTLVAGQIGDVYKVGVAVAEAAAAVVVVAAAILISSAQNVTQARSVVLNARRTSSTFAWERIKSRTPSAVHRY